MKDLYIKTPDKQTLTTELKSLSEDFVTGVYDEETEEVEEVLKTAGHGWAIDYIGKMVKTPAITDEEGNVVQEATYWEDGDRVNLRLTDEDLIRQFENLEQEGALDGLESEFVYPNSPKRVFSGS